MFSEFWYTRVGVFKICIFNRACYTSIFTIFKGQFVIHIIFSSLMEYSFLLENASQLFLYTFLYTLIYQALNGCPIYFFWSYTEQMYFIMHSKCTNLILFIFPESQRFRQNTYPKYLQFFVQFKDIDHILTYMSNYLQILANE